MIFRVTFKDPDGPYDDIREAAKNAAGAIPGIDDDERQAIVEARVEKLRKLTARWFEFGEYVTIEIDTDKMTATVVEKGK